MFRLFRKQRPILTYPQGRDMLLELLQQELDWQMPIMKALNGDFGPHALDSNIMIWDYVALIKDACGAIGGVSDKRDRIAKVVLTLLQYREHKRFHKDRGYWFRAGAAQLAQDFEIREAGPRMLEILRQATPVMLKLERPQTPERWETCEMIDMAEALEKLEYLKELEPILHEWAEGFLLIGQQAYAEWNRLGGKRQDRLTEIRDLAIRALQVFGRQQPQTMVRYFGRICDLEVAAHPRCCKFGGDYQRKDWGCLWTKRALIGLEENLGALKAKEWLLPVLKQRSKFQTNMVLGSL